MLGATGGTLAGTHVLVSAGGTQLLMEIYPQQVRQWINRQGGLKQRMVYLSGRELTSMYRTCR